ncbi:RHS repeat-associated core domain-containing protein [Cerasicoccus frondis]|uniref:RHS repeat-associated core domain-containing protein n=1 Tax=Cerasicoccus frondis TaxID=490090 RepID=UPI002852CC81|nr:RHS repeat-associated core domain-containing protein [Cerasicoccus frondis]
MGRLRARSGGGLYEVITEWRDLVETVKKRHYISTPVGAVAVFVEEDSENDGVVDAETLEYLHYDHQGSLSAITASVIALDGNGDAQNVRHNSYDAWGRQRDVETWGYDFDAQTQTGSYAWLAQQEHDYSIGYTGHENLDEFEIVHMNGRLYDAEVGRFISADPFIQFPSNLQSFNRYSYVLNNPLSYTDPSGYFLDGIFDAIGDFFSSVGNWVSDNWRTVVGIAVAVVVFYAAPYALTAAGATLGTAQTSFVGTVAGGIAAGGVNDGVRGAIMGGAFAAAFWVVGGTLADGDVVPGYDSGAEVGELAVKMVAHGVIGGTQQVFTGGDFLQGMFASAVTAGASPGISGIDVGSSFGDLALQTTAASMVGGTASVIAGGKFANGAYSAAFGYLFNQAASDQYRGFWRELASELNPFNSEGSFYETSISITDTMGAGVGALVGKVTGNPELVEASMELSSDSYEGSVLGQTENSDGWVYYGTRGSMAVSGVAATLAGGTIVWGAAGGPTMGLHVEMAGFSSRMTPHFFWSVTRNSSTVYRHGGFGPVSSAFMFGENMSATTFSLTGIPIFFPVAATAIGYGARNCFTGMCGGLRKGLLGF